MSEQIHEETSLKERLYYFKRQHVTVSEFESDGYILDLGGGGEGIIGQLKSHPDSINPVIAIDPIRRELEEAPTGPLKIVMDGRELRFLDCTFAVATAFFSLMYMKPEDHRKVFKEVWRVLTPGGRFLIWDVDLPTALDPVRDIAAFPVTVHLPETEVETGYGVSWPTVQQDLSYYRSLALESGFDVLNSHQRDQAIFIELRKRQ